MKIEHLVLSGGYTVFIQQLIILNNLKKKGSLNNLKSITGWSAGLITGLLYCLNIDNTNFINLFKNLNFNYNEVLISKLLKKNYIYNIISDILEPYFKFKNISIKISLSDFYKITNIELNFVTLRKNIKTGVSEDYYFSYKNSPDMKILDAITLSVSQNINILNFKEIEMDSYVYQDTSLKCLYISKLYSEYDNNSILYLGTISEDILLNLVSEDPTLYFKKCIFYKRNYNINILKNIFNLILNNDIIKNEITKNLKDNNIDIELANYNNIIQEIIQIILLLYNKSYRSDFLNVTNTHFENIL